MQYLQDLGYTHLGLVLAHVPTMLATNITFGCMQADQVPTPSNSEDALTSPAAEQQHKQGPEANAAQQPQQQQQQQQQHKQGPEANAAQQQQQQQQEQTCSALSAGSLSAVFAVLTCCIRQSNFRHVPKLSLTNSLEMLNPVLGVQELCVKCADTLTVTAPCCMSIAKLLCQGGCFTDCRQSC